ncbi:EscS/YscS/HrcS family type III secretion system export apparatus protein [Dyella monticola]|uniref:EscS/YscS/HrcS family type III secretion system export apparatus protein n=1 Tax=Dyella monticola TaxID=1927958 RepID=A0A370X3H8_9GAMM|nr:flagellar biosynthetic protein FliQ [Dyella monticola]RDS82785.1 EscS/YscS/HrcS family type III secretion system export apparatus protein [Dyella monticola]
MSELEVIHQAFRVILFATAPALLAALVVGVFVGLLQSALQVQDQAIAYVLKLAVVCLILLMMSRWLLQTLDQLFGAIYLLVPGMKAGSI